MYYIIQCESNFTKEMMFTIQNGNKFCTSTGQKKKNETLREKSTEKNVNFFNISVVYRNF